MTDVLIPTGFTPVVYLLDPDTEDLVWGDELADGMVVLIADNIMPRDPAGYESMNHYDRARLLSDSRWCRIEKLRKDHGSYGTILRFIGVYEDGSKLPRTYNAQFSWFVKKNSLVNR